MIMYGKSFEKKRYAVCYSNDANHYFIHTETNTLDEAEKERERMLDTSKFCNRELKIKEEIIKTNWYSYT